MKKNKKKNTIPTCCICNKPYTGYGNNPDPVNIQIGARCCDECNHKYVIPERFRRYELGLPLREVS